jgi:hypothetical protein
MRKSGLLILAVMLISFFLPVTTPLVISPGDHTACLVTLDVCGSAGAYMSVNAGAPCLHECSYRQIPLEFAAFLENTFFFFTPSMVLNPIEQPPKA